MTQATWPNYEQPPVVETVLGAQFDRIPGLTNAHLGAFWQQLGPDWPTAKDAAPLPPEYERFGEEQVWGSEGFRLMLSRDPSARVQIYSAAKDHMIQIQNGRLHFNWMKGSSGTYPRYSQVRPSFDSVYQRFIKFCESAGLGPVRTNQWEITYLNHVAKGDLWQTPADWGGVFKPHAGTPARLNGVRLDSFSGGWRYEIEQQRGRLHCEFQHGRSESGTGPEVLVLKLTARGPVGDGTLESLRAGLDLGHDVIVRTFHSLATDRANAHWGYRHEPH